jgi:integrase
MASARKGNGWRCTTSRIVTFTRVWRKPSFAGSVSTIYGNTFASLLIQNGESLAYVKEQLGHSSIKITMDVYGHLVPGANAAAVNRLPSLHSVPSEIISAVIPK